MHSEIEPNRIGAVTRVYKRLRERERGEGGKREGRREREKKKER